MALRCLDSYNGLYPVLWHLHWSVYGSRFTFAMVSHLHHHRCMFIVNCCRLLIIAGDCETICDVLLDIIPLLEEVSVMSVSATNYY